MLNAEVGDRLIIRGHRARVTVSSDRHAVRRLAAPLQLAASIDHPQRDGPLPVSF